MREELGENTREQKEEFGGNIDSEDDEHPDMSTDSDCQEAGQQAVDSFAIYEALLIPLEIRDIHHVDILPEVASNRPLDLDCEPMCPGAGETDFSLDSLLGELGQFDRFVFCSEASPREGAASRKQPPSTISASLLFRLM